MTETLDLSGKVHKINFCTEIEGTPHIEPLSGHRNIFRAHARGDVSGAVVGIITESVTEVHAVPPPALQGIAINFSVESSDGSFSGFYTGSIQRTDDEGSFWINGHGQVLSVTGAFAEFFLADVIVHSEVHRSKGMSVGESGELVISPRKS